MYVNVNVKVNEFLKKKRAEIEKEKSTDKKTTENKTGQANLNRRSNKFK